MSYAKNSVYCPYPGSVHICKECSFSIKPPMFSMNMWKCLKGEVSEEEIDMVSGDIIKNHSYRDCRDVRQNNCFCEHYEAK